MGASSSYTSSSNSFPSTLNADLSSFINTATTIERLPRLHPTSSSSSLLSNPNTTGSFLVDSINDDDFHLFSRSRSSSTCSSVSLTSNINPPNLDIDTIEVKAAHAMEAAAHRSLGLLALSRYQPPSEPSLSSNVTASSTASSASSSTSSLPGSESSQDPLSLALHHFRNAAIAAEATSNLGLVSRCSCDIGAAHTLSRSFSLAVDNYRYAYSTAEASADPILISAMAANLAEALRLAGCLEESIRYRLVQIKFCDKTKDEKGKENARAAIRSVRQAQAQAQTASTAGSNNHASASTRRAKTLLLPDNDITS